MVEEVFQRLLTKLFQDSERNTTAQVGHLAIKCNKMPFSNVFVGRLDDIQAQGALLGK